MNQAQALTEARKRWGKNAMVQAYRDGSRSVGASLMGLAFVVHGTGSTWAGAFRNYDERQHRTQLYSRLAGEPCPRCYCTMRVPCFTHDLVGDDEAQEEHVICRSCWLNEQLPAKTHRWPEARREALRTVAEGLHWHLAELGAGKLNKLRERERRMEQAVDLALGKRPKRY